MATRSVFQSMVTPATSLLLRTQHGWTTPSQRRALRFSIPVPRLLCTGYTGSSHIHTPFLWCAGAVLSHQPFLLTARNGIQTQAPPIRNSSPSYPVSASSPQFAASATAAVAAAANPLLHTETPQGSRTLDPSPLSEATTTKHPHILSFCDTQKAYRYLDSTELWRRVVLLSALRQQALSRNAVKLVSICNKILGKTLTRFGIRYTLFRHFCGGEDVGELVETGRRLSRMNVGTIVDYAAESEDSECLPFDLAAECTKNGIAHAAQLVDRSGLPKQHLAYSALKITALCEPDVLRHGSTVLNCMHAIFGAALFSGPNRDAIAKQIPLSLTTHLHIPENHAQLSSTPLSRESFDAVIDIMWPQRFSASDKASLFQTIQKAPSELPSALLKASPGGGVSYMQWIMFFNPAQLSQFPKPAFLDELHANHASIKSLVECAWPTERTEDCWKKALKRLDDICEFARCQHVRLLVDAEQTFFQPAIDWFARYAMLKYNRRPGSGCQAVFNQVDSQNHDATVTSGMPDKTAISRMSPILPDSNATPCAAMSRHCAVREEDGALIYNTYQMYLRNTEEKLHVDVQLAGLQSITFGAKVVRGAYICQETRLAKEKFYPSPVHACIEDTHAAYDAAVQFLIETAASRAPFQPPVEILCGTHNENSITKATNLLAERAMEASAAAFRHTSQGAKKTLSAPAPAPNPPFVIFAQLLGMSDHISGVLASRGYFTYKYVPFGPIDVVVPYLARRAEENASILSNSGTEIRLMLTELKRRWRDWVATLRQRSKRAIAGSGS